MKNIIDKITSLMLSRLGLDFELELHNDAVSQISADLYLGARPTPEHVDTLKKTGITHIVSCLDIERRPKVAFLAQDFETLFLPVKDGIEEDISSVLPEFLEFVSRSKNSAPNAKTLVHCEVGVSRSATLVLAYLMTHGRKGFFDAFLELRSKRAKVLPNIGFASQLQQLEHSNNPEKPTTGEMSSLALYLHQICHAPVDIALLQTVLEAHNFQALPALHAVFGDDIPRVIQGVR